MASQRAARLRAPRFVDPPGYVRHRPDATLTHLSNTADADHAALLQARRLGSALR